MALKQDDSIWEFLQTFEVMVPVLQRLSEHVLEGVFINGLRSEILAEVRLVMPMRLEHLQPHSTK